jgi:hypothetical protein
MAKNSKREQILVKIETILSSLRSITTARRVPFNEDNYTDIPETQMPIAVILGQLPKPDEKFSDRTKKLDKSVSNLAVDILVYAVDNETPDSTISELVDDIWAEFYKDISLGFTWVRGLRISPELDTMIAAPLVIFKMTLQITYEHDWRGI